MGKLRKENELETSVVGPSETGEARAPEPQKVAPQETSQKKTRKTLYERISEVMKEVEYVAKEKIKVNNQYQPISANAVIAKVRPAMIKHGIVMYPMSTENVDTVAVPTRSGTGFRTRATVTFMVAPTDAPATGSPESERLGVTVIAAAYDSLDKDCSKLMTSALKTAQLKLFTIETGEDEESKYTNEEPSQDDIDGAQSIDAGQVEVLNKLIVDAKVPMEVILSAANVERLEDIPQSGFESLKKRLLDRIAKINAALLKAGID